MKLFDSILYKVQTMEKIKTILIYFMKLQKDTNLIK